MLRLLTSIVLCLVAQAAVANTATGTAPVTAQMHAGAGVVLASGAPERAARPKAAGADIIKTAAAGPRDVAMRQAPPGASAPAAEAADEEQPHRTGPAMLIAALAVMTAIAVRRSGGMDQ